MGQRVWGSGSGCRIKVLVLEMMTLPQMSVSNATTPPEMRTFRVRWILEIVPSSASGGRPSSKIHQPWEVAQIVGWNIADVPCQPPLKKGVS